MNRTLRPLSSWLVALSLAACSSTSPVGAPGSGGTGGHDMTSGSGGSPSGASGGSGSGGVGDGGTGGVTGTGGVVGASGGTAGTVATGGRTGSGGGGGTDAVGTGGRGGASTGGTSSGGTSSGGTSSGGASSGGNGGGGQGGFGGGGRGGATDARAAAGVLDGFALLKPCFSTPGTCAGCTCDENPTNILNSGAAPENQHIGKQFGGDAGVTYEVKLRVAGVAERYWYAGGMLDTIGKVFYTGGLPTIHGAQAPNNNLGAGQGACKIHPPQTDANYPIPFTVPPEVAPADNCYNGFNIFAMTVSSPKQTYFLNYTTDFDGVDRQPHAVYKTDYTVTVPIAGQAKIDFYVIDGDHHQVANTSMTVPNLKNTQIKQPYSGNFLELEVVDVAVAPAK